MPPAIYQRWTATFQRKSIYELDCIYAGPLFIHQIPQIWLDLGGIRDDLNRQHGCDYFENSLRATMVHHRYGIENPQGFAGYSENGWGLTDSDGPGFAAVGGEGVIFVCVAHRLVHPLRTTDGNEREFFGYAARGGPFGPDDGTLAPWAVVASLPFAPDIVTATVRHAIDNGTFSRAGGPGFDSSFNPSFQVGGTVGQGWGVAVEVGSRSRDDGADDRELFFRLRLERVRPRSPRGPRSPSGGVPGRLGGRWAVSAPTPSQGARQWSPEKPLRPFSRSQRLTAGC